ncbi:MAG: methyltransferase domain-containing protein [Chloroflexota bacterium]
MADYNFFSENSPFLQHPLLTPERTKAEIDFVVAQLVLAAGVRVLDVGCGFGRHSLELAQRGYEVVGIDPAAAMIAAAEARKTAVNSLSTPPIFYQIPAQEFVIDTPFDAAICLFTTLGQQSASGENSGLVRRVYDALRPGGQLLLEVPQRETAVSTLNPHDRFGNETHYTDITRQFDPSTSCVTEQFQIVSLDQTRHFLLRYRLYSFVELQKLLETADFHIRNTFGSYIGTPLTPDSPIMIIHCQKAL